MAAVIYTFFTNLLNVFHNIFIKRVLTCPKLMQLTSPAPEPTVRCIAVIDDDPDLLDLVAGFLRLTFDTPIRCFASPSEALRDFSAHPEEYPLVITDFEMPGMNGAELLRAMRAQSPSLEAIVFSGSAEQEIIERGLPPNCRFLPKAGGFSPLVNAVKELSHAA